MKTSTQNHSNNPHRNGNRIKKRGRIAMIITVVAICLSCFATATFAWYTANAKTIDNSITAGYYYMESLTVEDVGYMEEVTVGSANPTDVPYYYSYLGETNPSVTEEKEYAPVNGVENSAVLKSTVTLNEGSIYRLTFTMAGSSSIAGFGRVEGQGQVHYTHPMESGNTYTVEFRPTVTGEYTIMTCWGSSDAKVTLHNYTEWTVTNTSDVSFVNEHWHECTYDADGDGIVDCDFEIDRMYHFYDRWNYTSNGEKSAYAAGHSHDCICGHSFTAHHVKYFYVYTKPLFETAEATPLANTTLKFANQDNVDYTNEATTDANGFVELELGDGTYILNLSTESEDYYNGYTTFTLSKGLPTLKMDGYEEQFWIESAGNDSAGNDVYNIYIAETVLSDESEDSWESVYPEENGDGYYATSSYSASSGYIYNLKLDGTTFNGSREALTTTSGFIDTDSATVISFTYNGPLNSTVTYFPMIVLYVDGYEDASGNPVYASYELQLCHWYGNLSFKDCQTNLSINTNRYYVWRDVSTAGDDYTYDFRLLIQDNYVTLFVRYEDTDEFIALSDPYAINANLQTKSEYSSCTYVGSTEIVDVTFTYVRDGSKTYNWNYSNLQVNNVDDVVINVGDVIAKDEDGETISNENVLSTFTVDGDTESTAFLPNSTVTVVIEPATTGDNYQYVVTETRLFGPGIAEEGVVVEHEGDSNFNSVANVINNYYDDAIVTSGEYTIQVTVVKKYIGANVKLILKSKDLFNDESVVLASKTVDVIGTGVSYEGLTTDANGLLSLENLKTGTYTIVYTDADYGVYEYDFTLSAEGETSAVKYTLTVDNVMETDVEVVSAQGEYDAQPTLYDSANAIVLQNVPYSKVDSSVDRKGEIQGDYIVFADSNGNKVSYEVGDFKPTANLDEINYGNAYFTDVMFTADDVYSGESIHFYFTDELRAKTKYLEATLHNPSTKYDTSWLENENYGEIDLGGMVFYLKDKATGRYLTFGLQLIRDSNGNVEWYVRVGHSVWYEKTLTEEQLELYNTTGLTFGMGFDDYGVYGYFTDKNGDKTCVIWRENLLEYNNNGTWQQIVFDEFDSIGTNVKDDYITGLRLYAELPTVNPEIISENGTVTTNAGDGTILPVGSDYTITITPDDGYEIDRIYLDGEDVTTDFVNNTATYEKYKHIDSKIEVVYRALTTKMLLGFEVWGQVGSNTYVELDGEILFFTESETRPTKSVLTEDMTCILTVDVIDGYAYTYLPKNISGVYYANIAGYKPVQVTFVKGMPSTTRLEFASTIESTTTSTDGMDVSYTSSIGMDGGLTITSQTDGSTLTFDEQLFDSNNVRIEFNFSGEIIKDNNYSFDLKFETVWGKVANYQLLVWTTDSSTAKNGGIFFKDKDRSTLTPIYVNEDGVTNSTVTFKLTIRIKAHDITVLASEIFATPNGGEATQQNNVTYTSKTVASVCGLQIKYENLSTQAEHNWKVTNFRLNAQKLVITAGEIADVEIIPVEDVDGDWVESGESDTKLFHSAKIIFTLNQNIVLQGLDNINAVYFVNDAIGVNEKNSIGGGEFIDELGVTHVYSFEKVAEGTFELTVFYYDSVVNVFYANFDLQLDLEITITTRVNDRYISLATMPTDSNTHYNEDGTVKYFSDVYEELGGDTAFYYSNDTEITGDTPFTYMPYVELKGRSLGNVYRRYFNSNNAEDLTSINFKNVIADTYDVTLFWDADAARTYVGNNTPNDYSIGRTEYMDTYLVIDYRPSYDLVFDYYLFRYNDNHTLVQNNINNGEGYWTSVENINTNETLTNDNKTYTSYKTCTYSSPTNLQFASNKYAEINLINPALYSEEAAQRWLNAPSGYEFSSIELVVNIYKSTGVYMSYLGAGLVFNATYKMDYDGDGVYENPGWRIRFSKGPWTTFALNQAQWKLLDSEDGLKMAIAVTEDLQTLYLYVDDGEGNLIIPTSDKGIEGIVTIDTIVSNRGWDTSSYSYKYDGVCEIWSNVTRFVTDAELPAGECAIDADGNKYYVKNGIVYSDSSYASYVGKIGVAYSNDSDVCLIKDDYTEVVLYFPEGTTFSGPNGAVDGFKGLYFKRTFADMQDLKVNVTYLDADGNEVEAGVYENGEIYADVLYMTESYIYAYANTGYILSSLIINGKDVTNGVVYTTVGNDGYYVIPCCYDRKLVITASFIESETQTVYVTDATNYIGFNGTASVTVDGVTRKYEIVDGSFTYIVGTLPDGDATMTVTSLYHTTAKSVSTTFTVSDGSFDSTSFRLANISSIGEYIDTTNATVGYNHPYIATSTTSTVTGWSKSVGSNGGATVSYTTAATKTFIPFLTNLDDYRDDYVTTVKFRYSVTHVDDTFCHYPSVGLGMTPTYTNVPWTTTSPRVQFGCWNGAWFVKSIISDNHTGYISSAQASGTTVNIYVTVIVDGTTTTVFASFGSDVDVDSFNTTATSTITNSETQVTSTLYRNSAQNATKVVLTGATVHYLSFGLEYDETGAGSFNDIVVRREYKNAEEKYSYPTALDVFPGYYVDLLPLEGEGYYNAPTVTFSGDGAEYLSFINKGTYGQIYCKSNAPTSDTLNSYLTATATIQQNGYTYETTIYIGDLNYGLYYDSNANWTTDSQKVNTFYNRLTTYLEALSEFKHDDGKLVLFMGDSFLDKDHFFTGFEARFQNMNAFCMGISSTTPAHWYYFGQQIYDYQPAALVLSMGYLAQWEVQKAFYPVYNGATQTFTSAGTSVTMEAGDRPTSNAQTNSYMIASTIINTIESYHRHMPNTDIYWENIVKRYNESANAWWNISGSNTHTVTDDINTLVKEYFAGEDWFKYCDALTQLDGYANCQDGIHPSTNEGYDAYLMALIYQGFSYGTATSVVTPNSKEKNVVQLIDSDTTSIDQTFGQTRHYVPGATGQYLMTARLTVHNYLNKAESPTGVPGHVSINFDSSNLRFLLFPEFDGNVFYYGASYQPGDDFLTADGELEVVEDRTSKAYITIPKGTDTIVDIAILTQLDATTGLYNAYLFVNGELVRVIVNIEELTNLDICTEYLSATIENVQIARPQIMMTNYPDYVRYPAVNETKYNNYLARGNLWRADLDLGDYVMAMDPNAETAPQSVAYTVTEWASFGVYTGSNTAPDNFMFEIDALFSQGGTGPHLAFSFNRYLTDAQWNCRFLIYDGDGDGYLTYVNQWDGSQAVGETTKTSSDSIYIGADATTGEYTVHKYKFAILVNNLPDGSAEAYFLQKELKHNAVYKVKMYAIIPNFRILTLHYGAEYLETYYTGATVRLPGDPVYSEVYNLAQDAKTNGVT